MTLVWAANFDLGMKLEFGGFLDYAGAEGNKNKELMKSANLLTQPYLALNINDSIALGVEYQYWQNKFGIKNLNESLPQLMLRMNL